MQPVELVCDCFGPDCGERSISVRHKFVPNGPAAGGVTHEVGILSG